MVLAFNERVRRVLRGLTRQEGSESHVPRPAMMSYPLGTRSLILSHEPAEIDAPTGQRLGTGIGTAMDRDTEALAACAPPIVGYTSREPCARGANFIRQPSG